MRVLNASDPNDIEIFQHINKKWRIALHHDRFYAEGEQVIDRMLDAHVEVLQFLMTRDYFQRWERRILSKHPDATVWIADKRWIEESTFQKLNQACLAVGKIPASPSLKRLAASKRPCCFVALQSIDHAVNVGTILRNCAAFEVTAVLHDETTAHPYSYRSIRSSIGGVFHLPVCSGPALIEQLGELQSLGVSLISADPAGKNAITDVDFTRDCCLIFGSEHSGLSNEALSLSAQRVAVNHSGCVDSLNVSTVSGIFLQKAYEIRSSLLSRSRKVP